jgi:hypothetical protein
MHRGKGLRCIIFCSRECWLNGISKGRRPGHHAGSRESQSSLTTHDSRRTDATIFERQHAHPDSPLTIDPHYYSSLLSSYSRSIARLRPVAAWTAR